MTDNYFKYIVFYFIWLILHESAHILCAYISSMEIRDIGIRIKPLPHVYVEIDSDEPKTKKILFTISGVSTILLLWLYFRFSGSTYQPPLLVTLSLQLTMDLNPFYSDIQILNMMLLNRKQHHQNKSYFFSNIGFIHFVIWGGVILYMINYIKSILL